MTSSIVSRLGTSPEEGTKAPCRVSTPVNITLSGEQTINTVAVVTGDRVLVRSQTDLTENGIYAVSAGAWTRTKDWNRANDVVSGVLVMDNHTGTLYRASFTGTFTAGTTPVTFGSAASLSDTNAGGGGGGGGGGGIGGSGTGTFIDDAGDGTLNLFFRDSNGIEIQITKNGKLNLPEVYEFPAQSGNPTPIAVTGQVYTREVNGRVELFYIDDAGNVTQLTNVGSITPSVPNATTPDSVNSHTVTATNLGKILLFNTSALVTVTVPEQATETLQQGFFFLFKNDGTGQIVIETEGSDTLEGCKLMQRPGDENTVYLKLESGGVNQWSTIGNIWYPTSVLDTTLTAPPATPVLGATYIVNSGASGDWSGHDMEFAIHVGDDDYFFLDPIDGQIVRDANSGTYVGFNYADWIWEGFGFSASGFGTHIEPDSSTAHMVTAANANGLIVFDSSSMCTVTLPQQSTEVLTSGFPVSAINLGTGGLQYAVEGSDEVVGIRLAQYSRRVVTARLAVADAPNVWVIDNPWDIDQIESYSLTAPPGSPPATGTIYYVKSTATGAWAGHDKEAAIHVGGGVYDFQELPGYVWFRWPNNGHMELLVTSTGSVPISID